MSTRKTPDGPLPNMDVSLCSMDVRKEGGDLISTTFFVRIGIWRSLVGLKCVVKMKETNSKNVLTSEKELFGFWIWLETREQLHDQQRKTTRRHHI